MLNSYKPESSRKMPHILLFVDLLILIDLLISSKIWSDVVSDFRSRDFSQQMIEQY